MGSVQPENLLVEPARIELASKHISERTSPSAVDAFSFAESDVTSTDCGSAILLVLYDTRSSRKVFLHA